MVEDFLTCYVKGSSSRSEQVDSRYATGPHTRRWSRRLCQDLSTAPMSWCSNLKYAHREMEGSQDAFRVSMKLYQQIL